MLKTNFILLFTLAFLPLSILAQSNQTLIPVEELQKNGINLKVIEPVNIAYNGKYFVCMENVVDLSLKAQGITKILHVIHFDGDKVTKVDSAQIPITHRVNAAVNDRKDEVAIIGDYGTKLVHVNLKTMAVKVPFQHRRGRGGYKMEDFLFSDRGRFYANAWRYDKDQIWKGDYIVGMSFKGKKARFKRMYDLKKNVTEYKNKGFHQIVYHVSGRHVLFNWVNIEEKTTTLYSFRNGKHTEIDEGFLMRIFMGAGNNVYYQVTKKEKGPERYIMKNLDNNKEWNIGKPGDKFTYPFMSKDGKTLIVYKPNYRRRVINAFYGKQENDFKLQRFVRFEKIAPMKFSADGSTYIMMIPTKGLIHGKLK